MKKLLLILIACFLCVGCTVQNTTGSISEEVPVEEIFNTIPQYHGEPYAVVHNNEPYFTEEEITDRSFESYSNLDSLGRCGSAFASIGKDLMPQKERGSIGRVKPSGWHTAKYDSVDGKYLYNRCHLIGYQLTAEDANEENLITGTRYMNTTGMLPFENMTADYIKETGNHVMYRVTPLFKGANLVADGVLMEAYSVEDKGEGITFCVFVYNVQPGISIDYKTGDSHLLDEGNVQSIEQQDYVLNMHSKKFHRPNCASVSQIKEENRKKYHGTQEELMQQGYEPCGSCRP